MKKKELQLFLEENRVKLLDIININFEKFPNLGIKFIQLLKLVNEEIHTFLEKIFNLPKGNKFTN